MPYMAPAKLRLKFKNTTADGLVVEMILWELPEPTTERPHGIKYRLHCGRVDGALLVRYDNEQGKGDHRHFKGKEEPYSFKDVDALIADFFRDVAAERRKG